MVPSIPNPTTQVNVWIEGGMIYVALTHSGIIPTYIATLILNSNVFDTIFRSMGYSTANAYVQVNISNDIPVAPINIQIPPTSTASGTYNTDTLAVKYGATLNSIAYRAIKANERLK